MSKKIKNKFDVVGSGKLTEQQIINCVIPPFGRYINGVWYFGN